MPEWTGEALQHGSTPDAKLADALGHSVEAALKRSVKHEPQIWADAICPIVLPAIRIAVATALRNMVQTLNQMLERSLSLNSWRWRWEAWRTGKPFAEVVLLRTLVYRVEQVLLIDRNTGLLLLSVSAADVTPQDTSLISAMLSAIQEFIHDSFDVDQCTGIRELHLSDFSLWIEQGPCAAIAAAVRGNAPVELRETLRAAVDLVHQEFGAELRSFQGDSGPFEPRCRTVLEGCLQSQYQGVKKARPWKAILFIAAVAAAAVLALFLHLRHTRQFHRAFAALNEMPGILVASAAPSAGTYVVEGLRDPLADSPEPVLARIGIDPRKVSMRLRPFISLDPGVVLKRARLALEPPDTIGLGLDRDALTTRGSASHEWILHAREVAARQGIPGIREIRTAGLRDRDLESLRSVIEGESIVFPSNSSAMGQEQVRQANATAAQLRQWISMATAVGSAPAVQVIGYADPNGTSARNDVLSRERASHVAAVLSAASVPYEMLKAEGRGASAGSGFDTLSLQRKVVFRLLPAGDPETPKETR